MSKRIALLSALALPATSFAATVWSSDFESGDFSAWYRVQTVSPDRVQFVSDPVRQGSRAVKITVNQFDDAVGSGNDRAEMVNLTHEAPGSEYFYAWSVMFAPDYPSSDRWQLFTQWHHEGLSGSPPLEMFVRGERMYLRTGGNSENEPVWSAPLERGKWQDFILHVKWSADPSQGFVELYRNSKLELPRTPAATMFGGVLNYLKMGLYRSRDIAQQGVVYFDDVKMATALEDVLPPPKPVPSVPAAGGPQHDPSPSSSSYEVQLDPNGVGCATGGGLVPAALAVAFLALVAALRRRKGLAAARVPPSPRSRRLSPDRRRSC